MKRTLFAVAILLGCCFPAPLRAQTDNTIYAKQFYQQAAQQFGGLPTVGEMVTLAQQACNSNYTCIIVIDPSLSQYATGTMPTQCANCVWQDYRSAAGLPFGVTTGFDSLSAGGEGNSVPSASPASQIQSQTGISVINVGVFGQTSTQAGVRTGAIQTTVTVSGGTIPTSSCAVTVTFPTGYEPAYNVTATGVYINSNGMTAVYSPVPGSIMGVAGTLQDNGSHVYTFTPTACPGSPVTVPAGSPWVPATSPYFSGVLIAWAGTNDIYVNGSSASFIEANIAAIVNHQLPLPTLVVGIPAGETYTSSTTQGAEVAAVNAALAASYPNNFLNLTSLLAANYNASNPVDVYDVANGIAPYTLRATTTGGSLSSNISDTTTCTFSVANASVLANNFVIKVDSEYILVTATSGGNVTACVRGYGTGGVAATHTSGTAITCTDWLHLNGTADALIATAEVAWLKNYKGATQAVTLPALFSALQNYVPTNGGKIMPRLLFASNAVPIVNTGSTTNNQVFSGLIPAGKLGPNSTVHINIGWLACLANGNPPFSYYGCTAANTGTCTISAFLGSTPAGNDQMIFAYSDTIFAARGGQTQITIQNDNSANIRSSSSTTLYGTSSTAVGMDSYGYSTNAASIVTSPLYLNLWIQNSVSADRCFVSSVDAEVFP